VLGMIDGEPKIPENQIFVNRGNWLRASKGGLLQIYAHPLERVVKGQRLAMITDLFGRERETLLAPTDGWIVGVRTLGTAATGHYVTNVAHKV
jgi:predicted deacylase